MNISEELALRLIKQRLPLRQERQKELELMRLHKSNFTKICKKIRDLDLEIDRHLIEFLQPK